jgi:hypothetical protein
MRILRFDKECAGSILGRAQRGPQGEAQGCGESIPPCPPNGKRSPRGTFCIIRGVEDRVCTLPFDKQQSR